MKADSTIYDDICHEKKKNIRHNQGRRPQKLKNNRTTIRHFCDCTNYCCFCLSFQRLTRRLFATTSSSAGLDRVLLLTLVNRLLTALDWRLGIRECYASTETHNMSKETIIKNESMLTNVQQPNEVMLIKK
jgi:hypothetical protein